jgi:protein phosphatase
MTSQEIMSIAVSHPPAEACRRLVDLANARGGEDNISTVVLRVIGVRNSNSSLLEKWVGQMRKRLTSLRLHIR